MCAYIYMHIYTHTHTHTHTHIPPSGVFFVSICTFVRVKRGDRVSREAMDATLAAPSASVYVLLYE